MSQTLVMRVVLSVFLFFALNSSYAQTFATTDEGKRVKLNENGTWEYVKESSSQESNDQVKTFVKLASATTLLKSKKNDFAIWYNASKWQLSDKTSNSSAEFQLGLKDEDGYCMMITERIEINVDDLAEIALKNAQRAAADAVVEKEKSRVVNGNKIKMLRIAGTASGIKFVYLGYYASNESGTIQLVCFTARNLFKNYEKDFEDLLNGLTIMKD